jgi:hypothetical protein
MTVNQADIAAAVTIGAALPVVGWFLSANLAWLKALREQNPDMFVDPVAEPVKWIQSAPRRLTQSPKQWQRGDARLEALQIRMLRRLRAAFLLLSLLVLLTPIAIRTGISVAQNTNGSGLFSAFSFLVWLWVIGYFTYRLAYAAYRYGDGREVSRTEFLMSVVGILGTLLISGLMWSR